MTLPLNPSEQIISHQPQSAFPAASPYRAGTRAIQLRSQLRNCRVQAGLSHKRTPHHKPAPSLLLARAHNTIEVIVLTRIQKLLAWSEVLLFQHAPGTTPVPGGKNHVAERAEQNLRTQSYPLSNPF